MKLLRSLGLVLSAVFLSLFTVVFSSVPLLLLRRLGGSGMYWILSLTAGLALVLSGQMLFWAPFLSIVILVGLYAELEASGLKMEAAALGSLAGASGFAIANILALRRVSGFDLSGFVERAVTEFVARLHSMEPSLKVDASALVPQVPSALLIFLMFSIWVALIFDRRLKLQQETSQDLSQFSVPDSFIWLFLLSIVASFFDFNSPLAKMIGENVFNVMLFVYFLQGLAVVGTFFKAFRVGLVWRVFGYFIFISQLFLIVSVLGLVDFWIDFRRRILKKSAETMREV
jgi:hypothetical protein